MQKQYETWFSISIHALLAESDSALRLYCGCWKVFLSTLSLRRATALSSLSHFKHSISIHALLAESDGHRPDRDAETVHFYPRSPCGERPTVSRHKGGYIAYFYPRSPCGERQLPQPAAQTSADFYPRSPCGERLCICATPAAMQTISIHALLAESDRHQQILWITVQYFYPRSPCGERRRNL